MIGELFTMYESGAKRIHVPNSSNITAATCRDAASGPFSTLFRCRRSVILFRVL